MNIPSKYQSTLSLISPLSFEKMTSDYLLQSSSWARVKQSFGWKAYAFQQKVYEHLSHNILVLVRDMPVLGKIAYIPDGILSRALSNIDHLDDYEKTTSHINDAFLIVSGIQEALSHYHGVYVLSVRWDTPWNFFKNHNPTEAYEYPKIHSFFRDTHKKHLSIRPCETVQPPATLFIDLTRPVDQMLADMKSKTRYNINLAHKKKVSIRRDLTVDDFYDIYRKTSERNNIAIHSKSYYQTVYDVLSKSPKNEVHIYGAEHKNMLIAAIIVIYHSYSTKKEAIYIYGATSDEYRNLMPAYALQWQAMQDAKEELCEHYDMFGIPPYAEQGNRMYGIYKFKIGFTGKVMLRMNGYEISNKYGEQILFKTIRYRIFRILESMRRWYYHKYKK